MNMMSDQINELMTSLAKAQGQMRGAVKDSLNPHFKSRYSDLASIWDACREPLASHGLAVTQTMSCDENGQYLITLLGHSSGQWMKSIMKLPIQKPGAQEIGSCISYIRRYCLASICGVYQDDDDGEHAEQYNRKPEPKSIPKPAIYSAPLNDIQKATLDTWISEFPDSKSWMLKKYEINSLDQITTEKWPYLMDVFDKKRKEKEKANPLEQK